MDEVSDYESVDKNILEDTLLIAAPGSLEVDTKWEQSHDHIFVGATIYHVFFQAFAIVRIPISARAFIKCKLFKKLSK